MSYRAIFQGYLKTLRAFSTVPVDNIVQKCVIFSHSPFLSRTEPD